MGKGIRIGFALHLLQIAIVFLVSIAVGFLPVGQQAKWAYTGIMAPFAIGVTQLVYMIPAILYFRRRNPEVAKGITIVAAATFLLNSACWGMLWMAR